MSTMRACGSKPPLRPSAYFRVPGLTMPCRAPTDPRLPIPRGLPSSLPSTLRRSLPFSSMTNRGRRSRNSGSMYLSHRSRGSRMWPSASTALYARVIGNPSGGDRISHILPQPRYPTHGSAKAPRAPDRQHQAPSDLGAVERSSLDGTRRTDIVERHCRGSAHRRPPHRLRADPRLADEGDLLLGRTRPDAARLLRGGRPAHRRAMHQAALGHVVVLDRPVLDHAVVPHQHVARPPLMAIHERGLDDVIRQGGDQRLRLVGPHPLDAGAVVAHHVEALAARPRMGPDYRMADRRVTVDFRLRRG